ncbi:hypothetical protein ACROAE_11580 [Shewanella sp. MF05960]|uniref:hypothetical protein n=1 Tax=Shewanella sp. MF05960 TaxID=3434874 RepID=UPI003D7AA7C2
MLKKSFIVAGLSLLLAACGGHGYEGQYESSIEATGLGSLNSMMPKTTMYIGTDYIESNGQKIEVEKIYVKEQGDRKILIMQTQEGDQAYIIDKDGSLLIKSGIATIKFTKVD